jgi:hypothetical protein
MRPVGSCGREPLVIPSSFASARPSESSGDGGWLGGSGSIGEARSLDSRHFRLPWRILFQGAMGASGSAGRAEPTSKAL